MRIRLRDAAVAIVTAVVVAGFMLAMPRTSGQTLAAQGAQLIRRADGKPDFSGIWQANSGAHWDLLTHTPRPMVAQPGAYKNVPVLAAPVLAPRGR